MEENWEFYFANVDDRVATVLVDLDAVDTAPDLRFPYVARIGLQMQRPNESGLQSDDESDTLINIENGLAALCEGRSRYVGRRTTNARREFFFYVADPDEWSQRAAACMRTFPGYEYEMASREDREWSDYIEYLYPTKADFLEIGNREACKALRDEGDTLDTAREIDFWAYFADAGARDAFVAAARSRGFEIRKLLAPSENDERFGAQLWRIDTPNEDRITELAFSLLDLAAEFGGEYDGWETSLVT